MMNTKNGSSRQMKLVATLTAELNPKSPVVMAGNPADKIKQASLLGYDAIELHWSSPAQIPLQEIVDSCKMYGMKISAFATGRAYVQEGLSLIHDDVTVREAAISRLKDFVDAASPHNATVIIGCIRGNIYSEDQREMSLERLAAATRMVSEYAETKNVEIVFEAINRYENNYLNTAKETADFIKGYHLPNTKILLDTFHMNIEDANLGQAILDTGNLIGYVHIADSNRYYAGGGHINLKEVFTALKAINYQGYISAECLPLPDSDTALAEWIRGVKAVY
jgi:sugar phosphate isomerase/epimerase